MLHGAVSTVLAVAALASSTSVGAQASPSPSTAPLERRLVDLASGFCVDVLSRRVQLPAPGKASATFLAGYGLSEGLPPEAMTALGRSGTQLIAGATLASGKASDGAFVVALGGAAGGTCRLIVYNAPLSGTTVIKTYELAQQTAYGWRKLPIPAQPSGVLKLSLLKRDAGRNAYLANLLAPVTPGPVAMTFTVAAVPANVTLPQGY